MFGFVSDTVSILFDGSESSPIPTLAYQSTPELLYEKDGFASKGENAQSQFLGAA